MYTKLLAALCIALPISMASAAEPIEIVEGGTASANAVTIEGMEFHAPEIKVKVGDSVTWTNKDEIAHNVHFRQGPAKGTPKAQGKMLSQNETYTVKFGTAGEYAYVCTPHGTMKGKVIVE